MFVVPCSKTWRASRITACLLCISSTTAMAAVGSWSTNGPYGGANTELSVYEAAPSTLFAAGRGGVFRSLSAGSTWQRIEVGLPDALYVQAMATSTVAPVLYLSNFNDVYRTGNGGDLWVPISNPLPPANYITDVNVRRGSSNSIAIATSNGAYVSNNAGGTWTGPGAGGTSTRFNKVLFAADGMLYLGIEFSDVANFGGAVLLKSTDGGASWAALATQPPNLFGIKNLVESPADPQRILLANR